MRLLGTKLLRGELLCREEALGLGRFLLGDQPGDSFRALAASLLRMRHTEAAEYDGLLTAIHERLEPSFRGSTPAGAPVVQIADPFDGVEHSLCVSPWIGELFRSRGFRVVHLGGPSSGPKYGESLHTLGPLLGMRRLRSLQELAEPTPRFGWIAEQADLSRAVAAWRPLRQAIIKRPFLATLEKLLHPWDPGILITSAFHSGFSEEIVDCAEQRGFSCIVTSFRGCEGSLTPSLARSTQILISRQRKDGSYSRELREFRPGDFGLGSRPDEKQPLGREALGGLMRGVKDAESAEGPAAQIAWAVRIYRELLPELFPGAEEAASTPGAARDFFQPRASEAPDRAMTMLIRKFRKPQ